MVFDPRINSNHALNNAKELREGQFYFRYIHRTFHPSGAKSTTMLASLGQR